jgi:predicted nucleic acid-binding protein
VILVDTGPLVAAALAGDVNHMRCVELFTSVHLTGEQLAVPSLVVTEACYLIAREAGPKVETEFVRSLAAGDFSSSRSARRTYREPPNSWIDTPIFPSVSSTPR